MNRPRAGIEATILGAKKERGEHSTQHVIFERYYMPPQSFVNVKKYSLQAQKRLAFPVCRPYIRHRGWEIDGTSVSIESPTNKVPAAPRRIPPMCWMAGPQEYRAMGKMPTEKDCANVKTAVEEVSRMLFPELDIVRVEVRDDFGRFDMDGDPLYVISVIFDNPYDDLDANRTWDTIDHLQPKLDDLGIEGYPLVKYLSTEMVERREKLAKQEKLERLKEYERKKKLERRG